MDNEILKYIINNYDTPAYVFDINILKERIKFLKNLIPNNVELCYAIKANTFIVKDIENDVHRFEVCSPGEYEICKKNNIKRDKILISGIYKTPKIINKMLEDDKELKLYSIESLEQFELFKNNKENNIKLLLRLTSSNQFGIGEKEIEEIIKTRNNYKNIEIVGIQYFSGTQKVSLKNIAREIEYIDNFLEKLKNEYNYLPQELEYGGGFPVFYFENTQFNEEEYLKEFSKLIKQMKYKGKIVLELGRSIAASSGYYITKVVDKKTNKDQNYAIVDGGINHLVYYGQSMAMKVPKFSIYPKRENTDDKKWNICGSLCTINDILVKQYPISNLKIGDVLIFKNTGAYCPTEGIALFLSRDLPQVLKIKENRNIEVIRKNLPTYNLNM